MTTAAPIAANQANEERPIVRWSNAGAAAGNSFMRAYLASFLVALRSHSMGSSFAFRALAARPSPLPARPRRLPDACYGAPPRPMPGPKISREVVLHVAKLASLSLSDAEADRFAGELARVVGHVEQLDAVDTRDVPPTAYVLVDRIPLRVDEVRPSLPREEALAEAPRVEADGFAVPAFLE